MSDCPFCHRPLLRQLADYSSVLQAATSAWLA